MSRERRIRGAAVTAAVLWLIGFAVLGTRWHGVEVRPGAWQDAVTLRHWAWFWGAVVVAGASLGGWVRTWPARVVVLVPLLLWFAVALRAGNLAPLAWLIYALPTSSAWLGGLLLGDLVRGPLARAVKHERA